MPHESTVDHENESSLYSYPHRAHPPSTINDYVVLSPPAVDIKATLVDSAKSRETFPANVVDHGSDNKQDVLLAPLNGSSLNKKTVSSLDSTNSNSSSTSLRSDSQSHSSKVTMFNRQDTLVQIAEKQNNGAKGVPHLFAETPKDVTHHHDTDDEDTDHSDDKSTDEVTTASN